MKRFAIIFPLLTACGLEGLADEQIAAELIKAARQVAQDSSYAWTSASTSAEGTHDWNQGPTRGKTKKDGYTYVTFTLGESAVELAFHGEKSAIKWADKWRGRSELKDDVAWIADRLKTYKFAAEEAAFLAGHSRELTSANQSDFAGRLNDEALRYLLSRGRREVKDVAEIAGTVRFWIQDGRLQKYEYRLEGPVPYGPDGTLVPLDRTTRVEIGGVGSTDFDPPAEAVEKIR